MNWITVAGIGLSLGGAALSFAGDKLNEHKMKETVSEEVDRQLTERFNKENEEEA